jgi:hypothetical protein
MCGLTIGPRSTPPTPIPRTRRSATSEHDPEPKRRVSAKREAVLSSGRRVSLVPFMGRPFRFGERPAAHGAKAKLCSVTVVFLKSVVQKYFSVQLRAGGLQAVQGYAGNSFDAELCRFLFLILVYGMRRRDSQIRTSSRSTPSNIGSGKSAPIDRQCRMPSQVQLISSIPGRRLPWPISRRTF